MTRTLQPELLDELPPTDPRAIHSRRDLRRLNAIMGNVRCIRRFLNTVPLAEQLMAAEMGAGDGNISLQIASYLTVRGINGKLLLIDRQPVPTESPVPKNWTLQSIQSDVFAWLEKTASTSPTIDILIANLFLHHFDDESLRRLLTLAAHSTRCFVAAEPLRQRFAPFFARNVWAIGCNSVTCNDAEISVRAGFRGHELSELWPDPHAWRLTEKRAGLFTHFFAAVRP